MRLPDRYRFPFLIRTKDIKKIPVPDEKVREIAQEHLNGSLCPANRVPDSSVMEGLPALSSRGSQETSH